MSIHKCLYFHGEIRKTLFRSMVGCWLSLKFPQYSILSVCFQILLFFWWIACTVISVYIVIFYGKKSFTTSSSETYTIEQQDLSENKQNPKSSMEASSSPASSDTLATMIFTAMQEEENTTCRLRTGETNSDKEYFEVKQEKERVGMPSHSEDFHSKSSVQGMRRSRYMYVTTRVRKLFHLVMIAVYIPGLMCNISMLYLASVVTLAVLVILEVIDVMHNIEKRSLRRIDTLSGKTTLSRLLLCLSDKGSSL